MINRIVLNEQSYHGAGSRAVLKELLVKRGYKKAFFCSDKATFDVGVTGKVTAVLDEVAFPYEVYTDIVPNPTIENVQAGVAAFNASGADCLIAVGAVLPSTPQKPSASS